MKLRTIGAVLIGTAMIGATLAGAVASADVPNKSWFIDPTTGQPDVIIVVGADASANDVVSASLLSATVGNMATVEKEKYTTKTASAEFDNMAEYPYTMTPHTETYGGARPARWYTDFELFGTQLWNTKQDGQPNEKYDVTVAIAMPGEVKNGTDVVAKQLSTLWYANNTKEWDSKDRIYQFSVASSTGNTRKYWLVNTQKDDPPTANTIGVLPAYAGGSYDDGDGAWDINYAFMDTNAWVNVGDQKEGKVTVYAFDETDDCDYVFGGTGTGMEAHEEIQVILGDQTTCKGNTCNGDGKADLFGDQGHESGIIYRVAEIRYPLLENGQNICGVTHCDGMIDFETAVKGYFQKIKFLGKEYTPLFAGATYSEEDEYYMGAYFVYGKPYAEKEKILKVGDEYNFHGWTINLNDVNIYENKAFITVNGPALSAPFTFIMVMDSLDACGPCCPECATYGGGGAFTSNPTQRNEFDPYLNKTTVSKTKDGYDYDFFKYVNFMLDGIKTFVGADGTYLAEFNLYAVEDVAYFEDKGCCDPFITTPNDYGMSIYGGWRKVAFDVDGEDGRRDKDNQVIEGGWVSAEDTNADYLDVVEGAIPTAYVLWTPKPSYYPCPDANFDTIELQLCDDIDVPECETTYTINGPENYFTVEIMDVDFGQYNGDYNQTYLQAKGYYTDEPVYVEQDFALGYSKGEDKDGVKITIKQTVKAETITYTEAVPINPTDLIKLDIEINAKSTTKNLILVGGPVHNKLVKDLMNFGLSTVNWASSIGEYEFIDDPYATGNDILIVAGANREETRYAVEQLISLL